MAAVLIIVIVVFIIALALWTTVTFDIVSNGRKTVITASVYKFIKYEFTIPPEPKAPKKQKSTKRRKITKKQKNTRKSKRSEKGKEKNQLSGNDKDNEPKARVSLVKQKLKGAWDSDIHWFDFEYIEDTVGEYKELIKHGASALAVFLRRMKRKIRVERLDLYIRFGFGEPDKTGIAYGAAHAAAGSLNAFIRSYFKTKAGLVLYLDPDYVNSCFEFELGSIIKTRAAHVLHSLLAALVRFIINHLKGSVGNVGNFGQASD